MHFNKNMKTTIETTVAEQASVSRVAYQLWENAGRPSGRDLEFWLAAEAQVRGATRRSASVVAPGVVAITAATAKSAKAARVGANGKKTWPKPYPPLPKF